jgi:hypothetical protein
VESFLGVHPEPLYAFSFSEVPMRVRQQIIFWLLSFCQIFRLVYPDLAEGLRMTMWSWLMNTGKGWQKKETQSIGMLS